MTDNAKGLIRNIAETDSKAASPKMSPVSVSSTAVSLTKKAEHSFFENKRCEILRFLEDDLRNDLTCSSKMTEKLYYQLFHYFSAIVMVKENMNNYM